MTQFLNSYHCEACDNYWDDQWSCACNDKCPSCNRQIEPYESTDTAAIHLKEIDAERHMPGIEEHFRKILSKEAVGFFAVFSRFEYSMKMNGMIHNGTAASWAQFAAKLPNQFIEVVRQNEAASILFTDPPRELVPTADRKTVEWSDEGIFPRDTKMLFDELRTIRNNLLHGDKKHNSHRDQKLIIAGLCVLNLAYDAATETKELSGFVDALEFGLREEIGD